PAAAESGALSGYDIDSRPEAETSSMTAYDTGAMPAFGTAPTFGTAAPPAFDARAPPAADRGAPPALHRGAAPACGTPTPASALRRVWPWPPAGPWRGVAVPRGSTAPRQHRRRTRCSRTVPRPAANARSPRGRPATATICLSGPP